MDPSPWCPERALNESTEKALVVGLTDTRLEYSRARAKLMAAIANRSRDGATRAEYGHDRKQRYRSRRRAPAHRADLASAAGAAEAAQDQLGRRHTRGARPGDRHLVGPGQAQRHRRPCRGLRGVPGPGDRLRQTEQAASARSDRYRACRADRAAPAVGRSPSYRRVGSVRPHRGRGVRQTARRRLGHPADHRGDQGAPDRARAQARRPLRGDRGRRQRGHRDR